jgi:hypothetical protein
MDYQDPFKPAPSDGVTRGDAKAMPNRGTSSGNVPNNSYGADTGINATNRMGSAHTPSDPPDMCCPPGDGRFTSRGHSTSAPGSRLTGTGSDAPEDDTPEDQRQ